MEKLLPSPPSPQPPQLPPGTYTELRDLRIWTFHRKYLSLYWSILFHTKYSIISLLTLLVSRALVPCYQLRNHCHPHHQQNQHNFHLELILSYVILDFGFFIIFQLVLVHFVPFKVHQHQSIDPISV